MRCKNCGHSVDDNVAICSRCGRIVDSEQLMKNEFQNDQAKDAGSPLFIVLGLLFPFAGFIVYFCWKRQKPTSAKQARLGAFIMLLTVIILAITFLIMKYVVFSNQSHSVSSIFL